MLSFEFHSNGIFWSSIYLKGAKITGRNLDSNGYNFLGGEFGWTNSLNHPESILFCAMLKYPLDVSREVRSLKTSTGASTVYIRRHVRMKPGKHALVFISCYKNLEKMHHWHLAHAAICHLTRFVLQPSVYENEEHHNKAKGLNGLPEYWEVRYKNCTPWT